MPNYLALTQDLRQEAVDSGTGPTTVTGNTGESARWCKWIADAWYELQSSSEQWRWMQKYFTVSTVSGTGEYAFNAASLIDTVSAAAITRFSKWHTGRDQFKCYLSSGGVSGEYFLQWMNWEDFRYLYRRGTQTNGQPIHVSVDNNMNIVLGPKPSVVYVVSGGYTIGPQTLAADADIPEMPTRFHRLITYEALSRYGGSRIAPEAMVRAIAEGTPLRAALELDQLPRFRLGRALV